jgi:hypothetical protein
MTPNIEWVESKHRSHAPGNKPTFDHDKIEVRYCKMCVKMRVREHVKGNRVYTVQQRVNIGCCSGAWEKILSFFLFLLGGDPSVRQYRVEPCMTEDNLIT